MEGEGLKLNISKTKMMVSGAENAIALSKMKPREICGKRVVLTQCVAHQGINECMGDVPK